ncbi:MAG TPA: monovalent cation/H+ antiporter subunit D family protein [Clostridiales bacterium]|nr:monovalent cation/H+ antiporter subunit D family protein [Clostridiales bacterium]
MNLLILFSIILPITAGLLIMLLGIQKGKIRNILVSVLVIVECAMIVQLACRGEKLTLQLFNLSDILSIYFHIDKLSILFALLVSVLWIFTTFYSQVYMTHEGKEVQFFSFYLITLGVTMGIAFSGNLFTLYIFYELLTLSTFPLVIHSGSREALQSGKKYLIYSFGGATIVLFGMILLGAIGSDMYFIENGFSNKMHFISENQQHLLQIAYGAMFLGFGVKAAIVPFHSWLPEAMVAPTPVSALLHAVAVVKSGVFALLRISYYIFGAEIVRGFEITQYISILIILTILMGSLLATAQKNLKKRLAYSTISQLGYILLGIILLNPDALSGGLLHLVNHAVIKITLFFCVGAIYFMTGYKTMDEIKGIGRKMPVTMCCFGVASISLIGIPPTNAFASKWLLVLGGISENKMIFSAILLLSAFFSAVYLLPILFTAFFQKSQDASMEENLDPSQKMLIPIVALTGIVLILGLFPNPVLGFIKGITQTIV